MLQSVIPLINMGRGGQGLKGKVRKRGGGGGGLEPPSKLWFNQWPKIST